MPRSAAECGALRHATTRSSAVGSPSGGQEGRLAICCWPSAFALFPSFFALLGGVGQIPEGERGVAKRCIFENSSRNDIANRTASAVDCRWKRHPLSPQQPALVGGLDLRRRISNGSNPYRVPPPVNTGKTPISPRLFCVAPWYAGSRWPGAGWRATRPLRVPWRCAG